MCFLVLSCSVKLNLKETRLNLVRMRADEKWHFIFDIVILGFVGRT